MVEDTDETFVEDASNTEEIPSKNDGNKSPAKVRYNLSSYLSAHSITIDKYLEAYFNSEYKGQNKTADEWADIIKNNK